MDAEEVEIERCDGYERWDRRSFERVPCRDQVLHRFRGAACGHGLEPGTGPAVGRSLNNVDVARLVFARVSRVTARDPVKLADRHLGNRQLFASGVDEAKRVAITAHLFLV